MEKSAFYIIKPEKQRVPETIESFVDMYESIYYLPDPKCEMKYNLNYLSISQCSRWIEEDMEKLLGIREPKKENWKPSDVIHMLAWKMGRINHNKSEEKKRYKFTGNVEKKGDKEEKISWSDGTQNGYPDLKASNRSGNIENITGFVKKVIELKEAYIEKNGFDNNRKEMLKSLQDTLQIGTENEVKGIGSVYLITILYFISGGKYPIYDQFAAMALKAILEGKKPGTKIPIKDLPDKKSSSFLNMLDDHDSPYMKYIEMLEKVSKMFYGNAEGYQKDRRLDRALWVYGHLFI